MKLDWLKNWYAKYERPISSLSLIGGFVFDAITLKRVDLFLENFWVLVHLLVAAIGIILLNFVENTKNKKTKDQENKFGLHFWLIIIIQFAFGGLLSTFLVFYFRSATLATSWPFLLILVAVFACNELLKQHYTRLIFQVGMLFVSIYSFAIYIVPVLMHNIGDIEFLISGGISLVIIILFVLLLRFVSHERFTKNQTPLILTIFGIFIVINILYFANLIPPIPLSLKEAGVYHSINHNQDGSFIVTTEPHSWFDYFKLSQTIDYTPGQPLYVYTAIFSPTQFATHIVHRWQHYNESTKKWETMSMIPLSIVGGRDGGYRTYSQKSNLVPGKWRVDVLTETDQDIGRVDFSLIPTTEINQLQTETL